MRPFDSFEFVTPREDMFLADLADRIIRKVELSFLMVDGSIVTGFPSGIDEFFVKVTRSQEGNPAVWLNRDHIIAMEETGQTVRSREAFTPEDKDSIEFFTSSIRKRARRARKEADHDDNIG